MDDNNNNPVPEDNKPPEENNPVENDNDTAERIENLERELEAAKKARIAAEKALDITKSEHSKLKNASKLQMTAVEELEEMKKELAAEREAVRLDGTRAAVKNVIAALSLSDKEFTADDLELFVGSDRDKAVSLANHYVITIQKQRDLAAKAERAKMVQEMPTPPTGSGEVPEDYQTQYNKAKEAKRQTDMIRIKREAHANGVTVM